MTASRLYLTKHFGLILSAKLPIRYAQEALKDLSSIASYVSQKNPKACEALLNNMFDRIVQLSELPKLGRAGQVKNTRECVVHPNYIIVYRVQPFHIEILRIRHAAQEWLS